MALTGQPEQPPFHAPGAGIVQRAGNFSVFTGVFGGGFRGDPAAMGRPPIPGISVRPWITATSRSRLPPIRLPTSTPGQPPAASTGTRPGTPIPLPPIEYVPGTGVVIDPETNPTGTVGETPSGRVPTPETGPPVWVGVPWWNRQAQESGDVAIDWGDVLGGALQDIASGLVGPSPAPFVGPVAPPPAQVIVDTRTGQVKPCRRRRRRRLLTDRDLADLASLKAIVGGGQAMNFAVTRAIRRS